MFHFFSEGQTSQSSDTSLYDALGVEKTSTLQEIKKAYRTKAMQHHPDKGGDVDQFKKITTAYEILSDKERRTVYDRFGLDSIQQSVPRDHMFQSMFSQARQGRTMQQVRLQVSLRELYTGTTRTLDLDTDTPCADCSGRGRRFMGVCAECDGRRFVLRTRRLGPEMVQQCKVGCVACAGTGRTVHPTDVCARCAGTRSIRTRTTHSVVVEKGSTTGRSIPINDQVVAVLVCQPDPVFQRRGADLMTQKTVSLCEALTGFDVVVTHLDDRRLLVSSDAVTADQTVLVVRGEGMPSDTTTLSGDLYIEVRVEFPSTITHDTRSILRSVLPHPGVDPDASSATRVYATRVDDTHAFADGGDDEAGGSAGQCQTQ